MLAPHEQLSDFVVYSTSIHAKRTYTMGKVGDTKRIYTFKKDEQVCLQCINCTCA